MIDCIFIIEIIVIR